MTSGKLICMLSIFQLLISYNSYSQEYCKVRYDYVWLFGSLEDEDPENQFGGSEINFNSEPPIIRRHYRQFDSPYQNGIICNKNGELFCYSNGCSVFDSTNMEMEEGDSLNPGEIYEENCPMFGYSGSQSMIILPGISDENLYFIFHIDQVFNHDPDAAFIVQSEHLYLSTLDATKNKGLGQVIRKNEVIIQDTGMLGNSITAVRHANGIDWWLITPDRWSNGFHMVLFTKDSVTYLGKQYIGLPPNPSAEIGQCKFSPAGDMFAWYQPKNGLFLYDFDRSNGILSNFKHLEIPKGVDLTSGGLEFSPSGRFLYVNHYFSLYQIDLSDVDPQSSVTLIADFDGFGDPPFYTTFYMMERTPDKRIILNCRNGTEWLHIIQEPDKKGTACRFEQHIIELPTVNNFTLPHFPNYRLGPLGSPLCDTVMVSTENIQNDILNSITIAPNPVFSTLNIFSNRGIYDNNILIIVYDLFGREVIRGETFQFDVSSLKPGVFYASIFQKNSLIQSCKFLKL